MAPALASDPVSQADTPMTDTNDDTVPSVPVDSADAQMVCEIVPTFVVQTSGVTCHIAAKTPQITRTLTQIPTPLKAALRATRRLMDVGADLRPTTSEKAS